MIDWLLQNTHPSIEWNYAIITLIIRFIGVFIVLFVIQIALQATSKCVHYIEMRGATDKERTPIQEAVLVEKPPIIEPEKTKDKTVAAIALAVEIEMQSKHSRSSGTPRSAAWSIAGRINQARYR